MTQADRRTAPVPLRLAAGLTALEAAVLVGLGVAELVAVTGPRLTMGLTTVLFFAVYGAGLGWCAWRLSRLASWARAPVVLAQLIQLGVAWSFVGGSATAVAVVLALVAAGVLAGIFHPASLSALSDESDRTA